MPEISFTVAIPTYNRSQIVGRAIRSVVDQGWPDVELLVIDDGSTDRTCQFIATSFPQVRYLPQDGNCGVGAARNRAIREASRDWVVFLDDDDTLVRDALARIAARLAEIPCLRHYPVLQFAHSNGMIPAEFLMMRLEDYLGGVLIGDFVPVIQREVFLNKGYHYPEFVRAGESLLWWKIAGECGIPTWRDRVGNVGTDAPTRITSIEYQIQHAREYAELQEHILERFGDTLAARFPAHYEKKRLGAATYWLLAGERSTARAHLRLALRRRISAEALGLGVASFLPRLLARHAFAKYRQHSSGWER